MYLCCNILKTNSLVRCLYSNVSLLSNISWPGHQPPLSRHPSLVGPSISAECDNFKLHRHCDTKNLVILTIDLPCFTCIYQLCCDLTFNCYLDSTHLHESETLICHLSLMTGSDFVVSAPAAPPRRVSRLAPLTNAQTTNEIKNTNVVESLTSALNNVLKINDISRKEFGCRRMFLKLCGIVGSRGRRNLVLWCNSIEI